MNIFFKIDGKIVTSMLKFEINNCQIGEVSQKLYDTITGIQTGKVEDKFNCVVEVK